ncbi:hypothetical protein RN01_05100 [Cupriavidus sp. SHE]|uniref:bactofilin family protein n=1 Tax=Cupriavidus TaxID=106589 RepID=UPI000559F4E7|nr:MULTISPECIES: polymer-forming cytoskeletal protein [Cupriavidus]KWR85403.1 hypothetical protein RN01_05100 [Cupriavidus sp. SHE]
MTQPTTFSLIQAGLSIHGDVASDHGISCFGLVDGDLRATHGLVHVGPQGLVRGAVTGEHVQVDGTVEGDVAARKSLQINGRVKGRIIYAGTIRLGTNAALEGTINRVPNITYGSAQETQPATVEQPPEPESLGT